MATKTYNLSNRPKLIDLNGDNINFKLEFIVQALNPEHEFNAIVLTQEQLDSVDLHKIEMKTAKGKISGNITANNNKYQNYFLVLKKIDDIKIKEDIPVEIITNIEKLSENFTINDQDLNSEKTNETHDKIKESVAPQTDFTPAPSPSTTSSPVPFYRKTWFFVLLLILILAGGFVYYNYYYLKKPFFWDKRTPSLPHQIVAPADDKLHTASPISHPVTTANDPSKELYKQISEIDVN